MPGSGQTTRSIVWAIVALFSVTVFAVVALALITHDPVATGTLAASLFGSLTALAAVLVNLQRTNDVADKVTQVEADTHHLVNGLLDAKVRTGVADVVVPELIDPDVQPQLEADRERVETHRTEEGTP